MGTSPVTAFIESATGISGMSHFFCNGTYGHLQRFLRGREDWYHGHHHRLRIPHLCVLRPYLCIHSFMGNRRCPNHRGLPDDSQVSNMHLSTLFLYQFTTYSVREINWDYIGDAVPAFLTLIIIPLSYKCVFISRFTCELN